MRLVFLESPCLLAMLLPAVLSVCTMILHFKGSLDSNSRDRTKSDSETPRPMAYNSASPLESATVYCARAMPHKFTPRTKSDIPDVLLRVAVQPAQSESTKVFMSIHFVCSESLKFGRMISTISLVPARYRITCFNLALSFKVGPCKHRESAFTANMT